MAATPPDSATGSAPAVAAPAAVIVLAAGVGKRMESRLPKMLHQLGGRSLLGHAIAAGRALAPAHLAVVVGHGRDQVTPHVHQFDAEAQVVVQADQHGTGHAVRVALAALPELTGSVVVTYGDVPLLSTATLRELLTGRVSAGAAAAVLTAVVADPSGYGRVLRASDGSVTGVVEHRDATPEQRDIHEINSGIYAFDARALTQALAEVKADNAQGEEYLTDVVAILRSQGQPVAAIAAADPDDILGVNDRVQLAQLHRIHNARLLDGWMRAGVTVLDPASTWIDASVQLEPDVTVYPRTSLHGDTTVAAGAVLGPDTSLTDTEVGARARIVRTDGTGAWIGPDTTVGPFAYLRPGTRLGDGGKIGAFVETKNADIGAGAKVPHLSYVGDATIGEHTNIGAASVFVNYDGVDKHHTRIGSHCRTGSDNMFVAPVNVGDGAYTGAGTVVRKDVPPGALALNVAPQRNVEGWVERKRAGSAAADAARRAESEHADENNPRPSGDSPTSTSSDGGASD